LPHLSHAEVAATSAENALVKEECRVVARACALSLVNEGEGGPNSAFCQIASNCDPPFFNERLDLMIEGKSRGDLEIYRTNLMEKGLSVDAIAQDQFFGHDYFQLANGITVYTSHTGELSV
jgi:hypothetical protein